MTRFNSTDHAAMAVALSDLPFGEQLLLWGIRMWVRSYNGGANIHNILHNVNDLWQPDLAGTCVPSPPFLTSPCIVFVWKN